MYVVRTTGQLRHTNRKAEGHPPLVKLTKHEFVIILLLS